MNTLIEFQKAIQIEELKNSQDYNEQMKQPLAERVAKGVTMSSLKVIFDFYAGLPNDWCSPLLAPKRYISFARIFCDNNNSKFKEGNSVILSNGEFKFEMVIEEDSTANFILRPNDFTVKYCFIDSSSYPENNWEINAVKMNITSRLLGNAAQILMSKDSFQLPKIDRFLNGETENQYGDYQQKIEHLNDSQNEAYLNAVNSTDFCIIQGPPGTGKTETIGYIAKYFIERGLKVFITAPTHTAINNCLNAIAEKVKDASKVIKVGEKVQNEEVQSNDYISKKPRLSYDHSGYDSKGIAIGATAYSLCYPTSKKLNGWEFDVAIIDEASQLSIPLSVAAMLRTDKWIFVGDHKQLDPIIAKGSGNEMLSESIFSRLASIFNNEINLLNTSYRLNEDFIKIPNILSYDGQLKSDSVTRVDDTTYKSTHHSQILNSESHILLLHSKFDSAGRSPFEAKLVAELIDDLLQNGVSLSDIGVMSPYRAQVREMKREIEKIIPKSMVNSVKTLFVNTVDSMQGQERDYIIYSMSNSHPLESMRRLDFFYSPNRLNVAITRARKKCITVANYKIFDIKDEELRSMPEYESLKPYLDTFKQYYALSKKIELIEGVDEW